MIKIGIIGAGKMCQNGHLPAFDKLDDCKIVAICDINEAKLEQMKARYPATSDLP